MQNELFDHTKHTLSESEFSAILKAGAVVSVTACPAYHTTPEGQSTPIGFMLEIETRYFTGVLFTERGQVRRFRKLNTLWNWARGLGLKTLIIRERSHHETNS